MATNFGSSNYGTISSYNSAIDTGWFRVVVRSGINDLNGNGTYQSGENWGFHLWYQTNENSGQWAHKYDVQPSEKITGSSGISNPTAFSNYWLITVGDGVSSDYNCSSSASYFKIKDIRSNHW